MDQCAQQTTTFRSRKLRKNIMKEIIPGIGPEINKQLAPWTELVREDFHVQVFEDIYPVTPGHLR